MHSLTGEVDFMKKTIALIGGLSFIGLSSVPAMAQTTAPQPAAQPQIIVVTDAPASPAAPGPAPQVLGAPPQDLTAIGTAPTEAGAGQWVYTAEGGYIWVPNGATTSAVEGVPYTYLYTPAYGWTWYASPWGFGPFTYGSWVGSAWPYGFHAWAYGPAGWGWRGGMAGYHGHGRSFGGPGHYYGYGGGGVHVVGGGFHGGGRGFGGGGHFGGGHGGHR
jgi:hypothetical protein